MVSNLTDQSGNAREDSALRCENGGFGVIPRSQYPFTANVVKEVHAYFGN